MLSTPLISEHFQCYEYDGKGIAIIPRNASSATREALRHEGTIHRTGTCPDIPIYGFIRDPMERHISGAVYLPGRFAKTPAEETYEQYVDRILGGEEDKHWIPQTKILKGIPNLKLRPYELLNYHWTTELEFPQIKAVNKGPYEFRLQRYHKLDTRYRISELMDYWADDYSLRETLLWQR